jgi:AGCS family alanine or glycine:cation symporter
MFYRVVFSIIAFVGCISAFEIAWDIADILNALMIVPNAICMILLVGPLYKDMMDYEKKVKKSK